MTTTTESSGIDYEALARGMQGEIEQLRLALLKARYSKSLSDVLPIERIRMFLRDPMKLQLTILVLIGAIIPLTRVLYRAIQKRRFFQ